ncbi:MAG: hypothetical protein C5B50_13945 [Verrucomicrobia bacterium]|nr:MAG: hypothetical protein C5B50_13945 [Verrucomicrobiota bacterium]
MGRIQFLLNGFVLLLAGAFSSKADTTWEYSVQVSATVQASPAQITLSWPQDVNLTPNNYTIYRKAATDTSWGSGTTLPGTVTTYTDNNVTLGIAYEYQIVKVTSLYNGYGYIYSGINVPMTENRGKLLLVVDNTFSVSLTNELARLQQDLVGDGWTVIRHDVNRSDSVASVKSWITSQYGADSANVKMVFLFGHVPVPYSGDIVPDGHVPNHQGAWPCDAFYGDMTGSWSDTSVNDGAADYSRNWNVPADTKYDPSSFPAPIQLMVGRMDLSNMPGQLVYNGPPTFPSELDLTRNYLNKDHNFRTKQFNLPRRAIVGDYFGARNGEGFAASGWRNYAPYFGAANIVNMPNQGTWTAALQNTPYLCAYGCGAGSFNTIGGLGTEGQYNNLSTPDLVTNDLKFAFGLFFGSWLGDWDSTDNIMRGVLAMPSYGLACAWSGRPHWFLHHMGLGETIGYGTRLTQNNGPSGLYQNQVNTAAGAIHPALMGDPSLRLFMAGPPSGVAATTNGTSIALSWTASTDSVIGYHVYRAAANGAFTRLTSSPITATGYTDSSASGAVNYMIRAVKLESTASGTYYNPSQGAFLYAASAAGGSTGSGGNGGGGSSTNSTGGSSTNSAGVTNMVVWVDDSLPAGAVGSGDSGDGWSWVGSNPTPYHGSVANQSSIGTGLHQHYFTGATSTLTVSTGDVLCACVYIDPANLPSEIMLQWNNGSWEHRAYWGANNILYGVNGTASCLNMGAVPGAGQWVLLQVPASQVGLEGSSITGMAFSQYGGRATWDYAGKASAAGTSSGGGTTNASSGGTTNTVAVTLTNITSWVDDTLPTGALPATDGGDTWTWVGSNPGPYHGSLANQSTASAGLHQHYFTGATSTLNVSTGDVLFAYVYLDPANVPGEIMLQWNNGSWEHRAYWGANNISYGTSGTVSRLYMGALPAAGQWTLLQVPASQVGLEGSQLSGMSFSLYDGRATFDYASKYSLTVTNIPASGGGSTNSSSGSSTNTAGGNNTNTTEYISNLPSVSAIDYLTPQLPKVGDNTLHVLTPTMLELKLINTKALDPTQVVQWNMVNTNSQLSVPPLGAFVVTANGQPIVVTGVGFKRRPLSAPLATYDLRIDNSIYLQLASPVSDNQSIQVTNPDGSLWPSTTQFATVVNPLRYSPAIHVNQEGYMPNYTKQAMVGYYAGSFGELNIPVSGGFRIVDANTGAQVYSGTLTLRQDSGYTYTPAPYQQVYQADFTAFNTPGEYRLVVPGMGGSLPFVINDGVAMSFARAYALGLYHQRCGTNTAMPYTRFDHGVCHGAPATVPTNSTSYSFSWTTIAGYANTLNANNPPQIAPALTSPSAALFPFIKAGSMDVSGGHHDAGDYSKYTINGASLIHYLMFAVDSLPGVAALDNLGIPESGDGISDVMQEAKWEADFLAKMQDADGGFYFLVYPQNREYENNVTPDHGDPQVVWPKTTSVTAASVAALAQCATSPLFKSTYPAAAAMYLQKAKLGWQFLTNAVAKYGKNGAYQKITHYGDNFADNDEMAWAACQMYLATGDPSIHQMLLSWFDPNDSATWRWGWWHMDECYGHAIRSYAFAVQSGRATASQLDATFLSKCQTQIAAAASDMLNFSKQCAYGSSFPTETKAVQGAGWYFSNDQAFDLAVAYQLNPSADFMTAMLANMNYEGGCNPVNVCYVTGLGWKRTRDIVSQWHINDTNEFLPPSGIPVGNIQNGFWYISTYGSELSELTFPSDNATTAPYPYYDRWADSWNVSDEMVVLNQGRSIGTLAFLAAQGPYKTQAWTAPASALVTVPTAVVPVGSNVTVSFQVPGMDLTSARVTWEARDQTPAYGLTFTFAPQNMGVQWVAAEAQWPDGRRAFAKASFTANSTNLVWVEDAIPAGGIGGADGGDSWNWVSTSPIPFSGSLASQSAMAAGEHQHFFSGASATLSVSTGDVLYACVYIDPANLPTEIMLQWNNGSWEHRAYWGANSIGFGTDGTAGRMHMGGLPAAGQWVKLSVPASQVGLEGSTLNGMAFSLYGGRATWDCAGRVSTNSIGAATGLTSITPTLAYSGTGATLSWPSTAGAIYQVTYKNSLTAQTWIPLAQVTATSVTTKWTDTTSVSSSQRYYQVIRTY